MSTLALTKALEKLGYLATINESNRSLPSSGYRIDTRKVGKSEEFVIDTLENIDLVPLDTSPAEDAVLVMIKDNDAPVGKQNIAKMLLGHDERQLFVAAVPRHSKDVLDAKDRLKPGAVVEAEKDARVKDKKKNKHRNEARIRQGDFFFVPTNDEVDERVILKNEPLNRGRGNSHMVDEMVRSGGQAGYERRGNFISEAEFNRLQEKDKFGWRAARRNPTVYVRGRIRHDEHKTVILKTWHRVFPNTETSSLDIYGSPVLGRIAFTD
jgi:hypothetical protein